MMEVTLGDSLLHREPWTAAPALANRNVQKNKLNPSVHYLHQLKQAGNYLPSTKSHKPFSPTMAPESLSCGQEEAQGTGSLKSSRRSGRCSHPGRGDAPRVAPHGVCWPGHRLAGAGPNGRSQPECPTGSSLGTGASRLHHPAPQGLGLIMAEAGTACTAFNYIKQLP